MPKMMAPTGRKRSVAVNVLTMWAFDTPNCFERASKRKTTTKKSKASSVQPRNPAKRACREGFFIGAAIVNSEHARAGTSCDAVGGVYGPASLATTAAGAADHGRACRLPVAVQKGTGLPAGPSRPGHPRVGLLSADPGARCEERRAHRYLCAGARLLAAGAAARSRTSACCLEHRSRPCARDLR